MRRRGFLNLLIGIVALGFDRLLRVRGSARAGGLQTAIRSSGSVDSLRQSPAGRWVRALPAELPCMRIKRLDDRSVRSPGRWIG